MVWSALLQETFYILLLIPPPRRQINLPWELHILVNLDNGEELQCLGRGRHSQSASM